MHAMESPHTKRQMSHSLTPQHSDPVIASLSTVGMRIRKAVADGYSTQSPYSYNPNFYQQNIQNRNEQVFDDSRPRTPFERTPLPSHMSQPPALTNEGSTFQSGSSVSDWGTSNIVNITTLPSMGTKRKHDSEAEYNTGFGDVGKCNGYDGYSVRSNSGDGGSFVSWEEFSQKNGSLKFDEDF